MPKKEATGWEMRDRIYILKNGKEPLTYILKAKNIFWWDEEKGYQREIQYTQNQRTVFVDEFKGERKLGHIIFRDGVLNVKKEDQNLQKILSLYHPDKDTVYFERDELAEAVNDLDIFELELDAMNTAKDIDIDQAEAILRAEIGGGVSNMTSKEIKRDIFVMAKNNPKLFLELAKDENLIIRGVGIKATERNIIKLSDDQRTFKWSTNGRKLMTVPFDENPYSALAAWFKTDEGIEVFKSIEKKLK